MDENGTLLLLIDALDWRLVEEYGCKNLMQAEYGATDISMYRFRNSMILWAELVSGKNMEKDLIGNLYEFKIKVPKMKPFKICIHHILGKMMENKIWREERIGRIVSKLSPIRQIVDEEIWKFRLPVDQTIFGCFENYKAIDVPSFNYEFKRHEKERYALGELYNDIYNETLLGEFESVVWENYLKNKEELLDSVCKDYQLIGWFTSLLDQYGHALIWRPTKMLRVYKEVDDLVGMLKEYNTFTLIVSDHGIDQVSPHFGDHSEEGFWSSSEPLRLNKPTLAELSEIIVERSKI